MLQIYIDGVEVPVSQGTFTLNYMNPYFSKSDSYTYDVDLDRNHPSVAYLYRASNRVNSRSIEGGRKVVVRDGVTTVLEGVEYILATDDDFIKIQIVARQGKITNFYSGNLTNIRDLAWGKMDDVTTPLVSDIPKIYPQVNYAFPVCKYENGDYRNLYDVKRGYYGEAKNIPFLMYYIENIFSLLGYNLVRNDLLRHEDWRRLLLVARSNSRDYASCLPNWTVEEFFDNICNFFACFIRTEGNDAYIIENVSRFDENVVRIKETDILDEFSAEYGASDNFDFSYQGVEYNFQDNDETKFVTAPLELSDEFEVVETSIYDDVAVNALTPYQIGYDKSLDTYFLSDRTLISDYTKVARSQDSETTKLRILPADTAYVGVAYDGVVLFNTQGIVLGEKIPTVIFNTTVKEYILNKHVDTNENMLASFYLGAARLRELTDGVPSEGRGPAVQTKNFYSVRYAPYTKEDLRGCEQMTMRLRGSNGLFLRHYQSTLTIDESRIFTIKFYCREFIEPVGIFVFRNRRFYCKSLQYTWIDGKRNFVVTGEFYAIKI